MEYLFGDTDIAARRLKVLGEVFGESTRTFVLDSVIDRPRLALDMGCGPGYTTHILADVLQCDRAVGLDNSEHFISLAKKTETDGVSFYLHDVTSVPFPVGPSDFLYCRFLLSHLRDPRAVVVKWATQLRPRGLLLIEEVEWIHTRNAVFVTYLNIVEAMLKHQSGELYVGRMMNCLEDSETLERRISQVRRLQVATHDAAMMFSLNIQSWKHQPFIQTQYSLSTINQLEEDLKRLTRIPGSEIEIEWGLRQLVFERI
ncbi:MAG: class I SAM-dependent methyltransferase [Candidatus Hydrogenedentota bacterium]|nr:MAG: class I SAM-dependent methyltransferase [Candidatus Hydrogenedentota bacterium]